MTTTEMIVGLCLVLAGIAAAAFSMKRDRKIADAQPVLQVLQPPAQIVAAPPTSVQAEEDSAGLGAARPKSKLRWVLVSIVCLLALGAYEWRYSAEMQEHIEDVNHNLERAATRSAYSTGLIGSLQGMTDEADVAGDIIQTHEYVHTLKDEMLARRIQKAAEDGITVGGAIQNVLAHWSSSVDHPGWD